MKNWILAIFIAAGFVISPGCKNEKKESRADEKNVITEGEVPPLVKTAFTTRYPGATVVIWEDAKEDDIPTIKVKFKKTDGKYWKAEFKGDGSFVKEKED